MIAWLAMVCLLAGLTPQMPAKADDPWEVVASGTIGSISWTITDYYDEEQGYRSERKLYITGTGEIPDYNRPSSAPWFLDEHGTHFTEINLSSGITRIGKYAFCPNYLQASEIPSMEIPDTVTEIGPYAFYDQIYLRKVKIPDSITVIGEFAFYHQTTIVCTSHSAAFPFAQTNDYYGNPIVLTDLEITLTLGPENTTEVTLNRGEEVSYQVGTNIEGITPKITCSSGLEADLERQVVRATGSNMTATVAASIYGARASCTVNIRRVYTVHLWEGFYIGDLGEDTYNENETYYPDYNMTKPGYVLRGWYTAEQVWSNGQGCYVFEFTRVTSVSGGDYDLFCFWDRDIAAAEIGAIPDQVYTGEAITPDVTITLGETVLVKDKDYTLSYQNNVEAGEATIEITGIGSYGGTVKTKFMIKPPATTITSLKNSAKKTVTVKWKKAGSGSGYEIQYGLKKNMKGAKTLTVKRLKTTSAKIKNLKKGKTYYVRIRVYKTVKNRKIYSKWSAVKKVKVTK